MCDKCLCSLGASFMPKCGHNNQKSDQQGQKMTENKLAKARKTHKSMGTVGLKKFGPGKLWVEEV